MPRRKRKIVGNVVYHVLNRANGRLCIFKKQGDSSAVSLAFGFRSQNSSFYNFQTFLYFLLDIQKQLAIMPGKVDVIPAKGCRPGQGLSRDPKKRSDYILKTQSARSVSNGIKQKRDGASHPMKRAYKKGECGLLRTKNQPRRTDINRRSQKLKEFKFNPAFTLFLHKILAISGCFEPWHKMAHFGSFVAYFGSFWAQFGLQVEQFVALRAQFGSLKMLENRVYGPKSCKSRKFLKTEI